MNNKYYTYAYLRKNLTPYYIGKGSGDRAYKKHQKGIGVPKDRSRIIFLKQNLTEEEAFKHEIYMIAVFGRIDLGTGILRNKTNGGEGSSCRKGYNHSQSTKDKIRSKSIGRKYSEETKKKLSQIRKGKKVHSEEWKKSLSERMMGNTLGMGRKMSEEHKKKLSDGLKNRKFSEETRKKLSDAHRGKKLTEEHKKNISKSTKGKKLTEEHKKKIGEGQKNIKRNYKVLWIIENIHTKEIIQIINLNKWCRDNNLSSGTMNRTQNHIKSYKGFRIISKALID